MILNDKQILELCRGKNPMIQPTVKKKGQIGQLSFGMGHFGYDISIEGDVKETVYNGAKPIDDRYQKVNPTSKNASGIDEILYKKTPLSQYVMYPGDFITVGTYEYFKMPDDVMALVKDKSTLARLGLAVQNTVLEPGWEGYLTIEISNHGNLAIQMRDMMPIAQVMFFRGETPAQLYDGRYQKQERNTSAKEMK